MGPGGRCKNRTVLHPRGRRRLAARVADEFLTSLEIFPTLVAACDVVQRRDITLDGFNMLRVLEGKQKSERTEMFWQRRGDKAGRVGNYKWVESTRGNGLFDLANDVGEKNDLSTAEPEILARVKAKFAAWTRHMEAAEPRGPFRDY